MQPKFDDLKTFIVPSFLGFDRFFDRFFDDNTNDYLKKTAYPPHNIIKIGKLKYFVELAVAGFNRSEIDIRVEGDRLIIQGEKKEKDNLPNREITYIHRGIANRSFVKTIIIAETIEVKNAVLSDGILQIYLEDIIPEHKKPKRIEISSDTSQQLLQESTTMNSF